MKNESAMARDDTLLRKLRRRKFGHVIVAGADALVAFSPDGSSSPPAFMAMTNLAGEQRLYPTKGGHVLKWPYQGQAYDPALFCVEKAGWDHEHCSACHATIKVGKWCWITKKGSFYVLCEACHRRVRNLANEPKSQHRGRKLHRSQRGLHDS